MRGTLPLSTRVDLRNLLHSLRTIRWNHVLNLLSPRNFFARAIALQTAVLAIQ